MSLRTIESSRDCSPRSGPLPSGSPVASSTPPDVVGAETLISSSVPCGLGFGLAAILALAVVPALGSLVESASPAEVRWTSAIAYLGLAVGAVSTIHCSDLSVRSASTYASGAAAIRAAIVAVYPPTTLSLDAWGLLQFGGVALWILVVCLLARRHALLPPGLAYLGIGVAVLYWFGVVGEMFRNDAPSGIGSGLGVLAAGAWNLWIGRTLWRRAGQRGTTPAGG